MSDELALVREILTDTAQRMVTLLDRLVLAEAVVKEARRVLLEAPVTDRGLWDAVDAWERGQPS